MVCPYSLQFMGGETEAWREGSSKARATWSGLLPPVMAAFQHGLLSLEEEASEMASKDGSVGSVGMGLTEQAASVEKTWVKCGSGQGRGASGWVLRGYQLGTVGDRMEKLSLSYPRGSSELLVVVVGCGPYSLDISGKGGESAAELVRSDLLRSSPHCKTGTP